MDHTSLPSSVVSHQHKMKPSQPIGRAEIEAVRGVQAGEEAVSLLLGLVGEVGGQDEEGLEERDQTTLTREPVPGQAIVIGAFPDEAAACG